MQARKARPDTSVPHASWAWGTVRFPLFGLGRILGLDRPPSKRERPGSEQEQAQTHEGERVEARVRGGARWFGGGRCCAAFKAMRELETWCWILRARPIGTCRGVFVHGLIRGRRPRPVRAVLGHVDRSGAIHGEFRSGDTPSRGQDPVGSKRAGQLVAAVAGLAVPAGRTVSPCDPCDRHRCDDHEGQRQDPGRDSFHPLPPFTAAVFALTAGRRVVPFTDSLVVRFNTQAKNAPGIHPETMDFAVALAGRNRR
jgi:hypothetical protein